MDPDREPLCKRPKLSDDSLSLSDTDSNKKSLQREESPCSDQEATDTTTDAVVHPDAAAEETRSEEKREAYYSANFKSALKTVLSESPERHVISDGGTQVVKEFMALPGSQQQLYVRLFLRKHDWVRGSKLSYKSIASDLTPVSQSLVEKGFLLDTSQLADPTEVLNLLQLGELKNLCRQFNMPASIVGHQKSSIIQAMFKHDRQQKPLFGQDQFMKIVIAKAKKILGDCVKVAERPREEFCRLLLLFSLTNSWVGGSEDDTTFSQLIYRMLQVNVGMVVYPDYEISVCQSIFQSAEQFEDYYASTKLEQSIVQSMEEDDEAVVKRQLSEAVKAFKIEVKSHERSTLESSEQSSSASFLLPFTSGWTYTRILSRVTEYLEKKKRHKDANDILELLLSQNSFCTGSRGRWADRLALNYDHHLKKKSECLEVVMQALKDPFIRESKRLSLLQRARKICLSQQNAQTESKRNKKTASGKKQKMSHSSAVDEVLPYGTQDYPEMDVAEAPEVHIAGHRLGIAPIYLTSTRLQSEGSKSTPSSFEDSSSSSNGSGQHTQTLSGVEGYAIHHYSSELGWPCALHAEGSSFTTLFALLMWEVIFTPGIPDVFRTKFQSGPLDMYSTCFYQNRKRLVDERLAVIGQATNEEVGTMIEESWDRRYGQLCVGVNWELFPTKEDAKNLAACMGGQLLSHICEVFSKDYRHSVGGLPDLVLWNPADKACKFVEVKGPGDRLSHKQIVWLSRLSKWSCDVEVCRVTAKRKLSS